MAAPALGWEQSSHPEGSSSTGDHTALAAHPGKATSAENRGTRRDTGTQGLEKQKFGTQFPEKGQVQVPGENH